MNSNLTSLLYLKKTTRRISEVASDRIGNHLLTLFLSHLLSFAPSSPLPLLKSNTRIVFTFSPLSFSLSLFLPFFSPPSLFLIFALVFRFPFSFPIEKNRTKIKLYWVLFFSPAFLHRISTFVFFFLV